MITNVDPQEIAKFEELAHRWWDPRSEFRTLHEINPLRLDYINRQVPLAGKKVLDVGCGGGILSESMARAGAEVTGIDMGKAPLSVARLHGLESGVKVTYHQTTAEEFAHTHTQKFDLITCMEMLEHVPDPDSVIRACATMVKPGGSVFFSTLNRNPKSWLYAIVGAEYILKLLPKGTHQYQKFIRPSELAGWCRQAALALVDTTGLAYNPLTRQYRLVPDVSVSYLVHTRREDGTPAHAG